MREPDPESTPPSQGSERRLQIGLAGLVAVMGLMAFAVHRWVGREPRRPAPPDPPSPMLSRPQLLESQQAMPELRDFDAQTPPANPFGGQPLDAPGLPSSLDTRGPGH